MQRVSANPYVFVAAAIASLAVGVTTYNQLMALQEEQVEVTTKSVEEYIKELEKARDEKVLDKLNESIAKNVLELQKQLDTLNATSEAEKLSIKLGRDLDAKEMRIIRLIAKEKKNLKN